MMNLQDILKHRYWDCWPFKIFSSYQRIDGYDGSFRDCYPVVQAKIVDGGSYYHFLEWHESTYPHVSYHRINRTKILFRKDIKMENVKSALDFAFPNWDRTTLEEFVTKAILYNENSKRKHLEAINAAKLTKIERAYYGR